ncbi:alanine racemase [Sinimarinibacterium flocculans]|uniref:D-serine deaminase-like pyridoxal phosphate-dependent protein n=1 Tax=Sinimarinibacterium flocculans TaxID=985250 RepID=A0A318E3T6_9GAMM|nr:alanine racemase [Sinimarinibacterium flocculans]PXV64891.1 D-serine deaminase-like pyridoxal phosphate-dependent protein [Sinimarinibacterium flocculans]
MNRRRRLLLGAAVAAPLAAVVAAKPRARAGAHDAYFRALQSALADAGLMRPTLVIDRARLQHNLARLQANRPRNFAYRIVAKSLPSLPLIETVRRATGTDRLMVFHQPFLNLVGERMPDARVLLGKPMPAGAVTRFFAHHRNPAFDPSARIEWLVDTPVRIAEYAELARARAAEGLGPMRLNFEIDVGLHRGGLRDGRAVAEALRAVQAEPSLRFSGLMGYEAHASKMPGLLGGPRGALDRAMQAYAEALGAVRETLGDTFDASALTLNAGGSSTYAMYDGSEPCNELAMGSGLVMPTDFDVPSLADHQPASYIATPVLKALDRTEIAGIESLTGLFRAWDPNTARAFFLYGGYWLADPVSPPGLQRNAIWGHSTNQDLYNGSVDVELAVGDHVFLRPHQSEFVFLQFGDIAVYDDGRIVETWPVFTQGA